MSIATTPELKRLVMAMDHDIPADTASDLLAAFYEVVRTEVRAEALREAATFAGELAEQFRGSGGEMAEDREWGAAQVAQELFNLVATLDGGDQR